MILKDIQEPLVQLDEQEILVQPDRQEQLAALVFQDQQVHLGILIKITLNLWFLKIRSTVFIY